MNIISLFDGMGIGLLALINSGKRNFNYYRVEIDKKANEAFRHFFTDDFLIAHGVKVINYNDVLDFPPADDDNIKQLESEGVDLLLAGSPCQGFSVAGNQLNFEDPRSKLFFEFIRIRDLYKPKYFLLENVKMKQEFSDVIDDYCGPHYEVDSAEFTAQQRKRLYWTNILVKTWPTSNPLVVEDILEEEVDDKYFIEPRRAVVICDNECAKRKIGFIGTDSMGNRIYSIHGKSVTLIANAGGLGGKTGLYAMPCLSPDREEKRQNGRRFKPPRSKFYTLTTIDRHGVLIGNYIRKLTPKECERLQGWPDDMTIGAGSDNARYKICGNGWTEPVIRHILSSM
jgi:DNA (cytosine-5)-methyltransferase 3A